jgi:zinc transporter ZupT
LDATLAVEPKQSIRTKRKCTVVEVGNIWIHDPQSFFRASGELMNSPYELVMASLLGLGTTSSSLLGAAIGLYVPFSKRPLACLLAFAAGYLISALAIELAYEGALSLHQQGYNARAAWAFVSAGFAASAIIYYSASIFLENKGAAVRYVT